MENTASGGYRLLVEMRRAMTPQGAARFVSGDILMYIKRGALQAHPGQVIRWRSTLRRPLSFGNPGEFDHPLYLAARGIHTTAFIAQAEQVVILVNQADEPNAHLEDWRHSLVTHIAQTVPAEVAVLLQSLFSACVAASAQTPLHKRHCTSLCNFRAAFRPAGTITLLVGQMGLQPQ
jgi:predicted membrane metal-binding protein